MATIHQKKDLLRGLLSGDLARGGPFYVTIDLTRRCNLQCPDCQYHSLFLDRASSTHSKARDFPPSQFAKLCKELSSMGTRGLILTGEGEPFLHSHLFELISMAKTAGFEIILFTNGTLLDESNIRALVSSQVDTLKVSLWANSSEEYEKNYPGSSPDSFGKIVHGLETLKELKNRQNSKTPAVVLHQPINRQNFENIDARISLANATGCNILSFSPVWSWRAPSSLSPDESRNLCISLARMKKRLDSLSLKHNLDETLLRYRIGEAVWEKIPCYIAWYHARIRVSGDVLPCQRCDLPMGNLEERAFREIWNGTAYRKFRMKTRTRRGFAFSRDHCDCRFCCYAADNWRVHRAIRWILPLRRLIEPFA